MKYSFIIGLLFFSLSAYSYEFKNTYLGCSETLRESKSEGVLNQEQVLSKLEGLLDSYDSYGTSSAGQVNVRESYKLKIAAAKSKCFGLSQKIDSKIESIERAMFGSNFHGAKGNPRIHDTDLKPSTPAAK